MSYRAIASLKLRSFWIGFGLLLAVNVSPSGLLAAPTAEVAKRCMRYSYIKFPYKRPGAVRMSGDRQAYFKNCVNLNGSVEEPNPRKIY